MDFRLQRLVSTLRRRTALALVTTLRALVTRLEAEAARPDVEPSNGALPADAPVTREPVYIGNRRPSGPPADWIEKVRKGAPHLLRPELRQVRRSPAVQNVPAPVPAASSAPSTSAAPTLRRPRESGSTAAGSQPAQSQPAQSRPEPTPVAVQRNAGADAEAVVSRAGDDPGVVEAGPIPSVPPPASAGKPSKLRLFPRYAVEPGAATSGIDPFERADCIDPTNRASPTNRSVHHATAADSPEMLGPGARREVRKHPEAAGLVGGGVRPAVTFGMAARGPDPRLRPAESIDEREDRGVNITADSPASPRPLVNPSLAARRSEQPESGYDRNKSGGAWMGSGKVDEVFEMTIGRSEAPIPQAKSSRSVEPCDGLVAGRERPAVAEWMRRAPDGTARDRWPALPVVADECPLDELLQNQAEWERRQFLAAEQEGRYGQGRISD